jgi:uncharacterized RmlC-like cupin family protein
VDRGRLIEIFRGDEEIKAVLGGVKQVVIVNLAPGDKAGSHVHKVKREILYVMNGWVKGIFRDRASGEKLSLHLEAGRKINVLPGIEHVFVNESDDDVSLLEFSGIPFDEKNPDAEKVEF